MGLFKDHTWFGKIEKYFTQTINPFYWARKGLDSIAGTNTTNLGLGEIINVDKERDTGNTGINGVDLDNISSSDLFDLAVDSSSNKIVGGVVGSLPLVGGLLEQALTGQADANDKQLSILQNLYEMQNNNNQASINRQWQSEQAVINREFQRGERLDAQQYQTDMWNMSNEYNSLSSQLERARKAGVSPNAIIGGNSNSGFASPMSSSPQSGSMPSGSQASYSSGLSSDLLTNSAMVENLMAQTKKTNSETNLNEQQFDFFKLTTPQRVALFNNEVAHSALVNVGLDKDNEIKDFTIETQRRSFELYCQNSEEEIKLKKARTTDYYNQNLERIERIKLIGEQIKTEQKKQDNIQQDTYESTHRISLMNQQEATEQQRTLIAEYDALLADIELNFCKIMGVPAGTDESAFMTYLWMSGQYWNYYNALANQGLSELVRAPGRILSRSAPNTSHKSNKTTSPPYAGSFGGSKGVINP